MDQHFLRLAIYGYISLIVDQDPRKDQASVTLELQGPAQRENTAGLLEVVVQ